MVRKALSMLSVRYHHENGLAELTKLGIDHRFNIGLLSLLEIWPKYLRGHSIALPSGY